MKKVAFFLLLVSTICFSQSKITMNTDLAAKKDTCIKQFRFNGITYISFEFTNFRSDTTEITLYSADYDRTLGKFIPVNAGAQFNTTFPKVLNKTTYRTIFDCDLDGDLDTISAWGVNITKGWPANSLCWKTAKQDSGLMIVRISR